MAHSYFHQGKHCHVIIGWWFHTCPASCYFTPQTLQLSSQEEARNVCTATIIIKAVQSFCQSTVSLCHSVSTPSIGAKYVEADQHKLFSCLISLYSVLCLCLKVPICAIFFKSRVFKHIKYDIPVFQLVPNFTGPSFNWSPIQLVPHSTGPYSTGLLIQDEA